MLAATKVKMSGSEKEVNRVNRTTYNISTIKLVTRKFLEVSRCRRARGKEMYKKGVLHLHLHGRI